MANSAAGGAATRVGAPTRAEPGALRRLRLRASTRLRRSWLDGRIARGVERAGDRRLALREAQLVGRRERRRLALCFQRVLAQGAPAAALSSAAPVDHRAVEIARPVLTELILALLSSEPVEARGMVVGRRLLTDPRSPVYAQQGRPVDLDRLSHQALAVLFALRPRAGLRPGTPAGDRRPASGQGATAP